MYELSGAFQIGLSLNSATLSGIEVPGTKQLYQGVSNGTGTFEFLSEKIPEVPCE